MSREFVFSWAENVDGRMVHIDSVQRGLACGCICPNCHEKLLARQGNVREHGFAHHSETRGANLEICYMVSLYKLAEQIVQTKKRIHVPSYYGIYKETDIEFVDVKLDSRFEREDKQPDVIAITNDGKQYLIEFVFEHKVQHKQAIDYKDLSCLEIDISKQSLESLEDFLLSSNEDRKWINNEIYFSGIEEKYRNAGKTVKVVFEANCLQCVLRDTCCAIMKSLSILRPLLIENNGQMYRLCKIEQYEEKMKAFEQELLQEKQERQEKVQKNKGNTVLKKKKGIADREFVANQNFSTSQIINEIQTEQKGIECDTSKKSCFNCEYNLAWANKKGFADCGCYKIMRLPKQQISPDYAERCKGFKRKNEKGLMKKNCYAAPK